MKTKIVWLILISLITSPSLLKAQTGSHREERICEIFTSFQIDAETGMQSADNYLIDMLSEISFAGPQQGSGFIWSENFVWLRYQGLLDYFVEYFASPWLVYSRDGSETYLGFPRGGSLWFQTTEQSWEAVDCSR